jgi:hypothetical protein
MEPGRLSPCESKKKRANSIKEIETYVFFLHARKKFRTKKR